MKSIELFSGTGGLALGLQQAGFDHEALFEWDKDSCDSIVGLLVRMNGIIPLRAEHSVFSKSI